MPIPRLIQGGLSSDTPDNVRTVAQIFEQRMRHLPQVHRLVAIYDSKFPGRVVSEAFIKAAIYPGSSGNQYTCGSCGSVNSEYQVLSEEFEVDVKTITKAFIVTDCEGLKRYLRISINGKEILNAKRIYAAGRADLEACVRLATRVGVFDVSAMEFSKNKKESFGFLATNFVESEANQASFSIEKLNKFWLDSDGNVAKFLNDWYSFNGVPEPAQRVVRAVVHYNRLIASGHTTLT